MPYKIEVVNETIQGVWQDVMNLAIVMGQGGNNAFRAPATPEPEQPVVAVTSVDPETMPNAASYTEAEENPKVAPLPAEKRKPGRPPKPVVIEAKAEEVIDFDLGPATKTLTLKDDIQPRVRAIVDNYKERNPKVEEKAAMQGAVNYAVALLAKFGVKKATDLTPDQFADFMAQSEAYVTGAAI